MCRTTAEVQQHKESQYTVPRLPRTSLCRLRSSASHSRDSNKHVAALSASRQQRRWCCTVAGASIIAPSCPAHAARACPGCAQNHGWCACRLLRTLTGMGRTSRAAKDSDPNLNTRVACCRIFELRALPQPELLHTCLSLHGRACMPAAGSTEHHTARISLESVTRGLHIYM